MKSGKMTSVLVIGVAMLLAACGGGGDSGTTSPPAVAAPLNGVFIDSPVQGLHYTAQPSSLSGFTDAEGRYNYRVGDAVQFDIGGRPIGGSVTGAPIVTALTLFGATSTSDPRVINLSQLLLGLGTVNGNGVIVLPPTIPPALPNPLDFAAANFDATVQNAGIPLASEPTATTHLAQSFSAVSVTLAGTGSGSVVSNPTGINCSINGGASSGTCSTVLSNGFSVTLTPTGSGFAGWSGGTGSAVGCNGATGACTFNLTVGSTVIATFNVPPPSTLTISNSGTGTGSVACNANNSGFGACASQYADGTQLILRATANGGSTFTGWTGGTGNAAACPNSPADCSMTVNTNTTVTANFVLNVVTQFSVTSSTATGNGGGGTIQCSANGVPGPCGSYPVNTVISVIPTPNSASLFTGWSNGTGSVPTPNCNSATGACNFTVTADSSITANFNRPVLTVNVAGTGTVNSTPAGINNCTTLNCQAPFDRGTLISLTAGGAGFTSWSGGGCAGNGICQVTLNASTVVTATFGTVSNSTTFKFIGAPGRELLAVNPASPGTTTAVKVNNQNVILGNPPVASGTTLDRSSNGSLLLSGTFGGNSTVTNIHSQTIVFTSGGRVYKASTLISDGVPGSVPANEPQQVSSLTGVVSCGLGQAYDVVNPNPGFAVVTPGSDSLCNTPDDQIIVMHLNDSTGTAPVTLPAGTVPHDSLYDLNTGAVLQVLVVDALDNLKAMDPATVALTPIVNGAGIGVVAMLAQQPDKVFLANSTNLYAYTPSTHTLNATPVVTADANTVFVNAENGDSADLNNIFLVQSDGAVYKVPLTTAPGTHITVKHVTASGNTVAYDARLTPNKVIITTGSQPSFDVGAFSPCYTAVPRSCNNGIIAVDKVTPNLSTVIEAADPQKIIFPPDSFGNYVLYTINDVPPSAFNGAARIIENGPSSARELVGSNGGWAGKTLATSVSLINLHSATALATFSHFTALGPPALGTISVISSPTGAATLLGTVTSSPAVTNLPGFWRDETQNTAMIGIAPLQASPSSNQPFFVDAALANSLAPITTPGLPAPWQPISDE